MLELLLLPFKIVVFLLKLAFGLLFLFLGVLLIPVLLLAGLFVLARWALC